MIMHGLGAQLHFDGLASIIPHHGMKGLVTIHLGPGNVVVKLVADRRVLAMYPTECKVTVVDRGHHNAQGADVVDLVKTEGFAAHFFINAVYVFGAALDGYAQSLLR